MSRALRLEQFSFEEILNGKLSWRVDDLHLTDLILVTGESCQGKTRLINVFKFLKALHTRTFRFPAADVQMEAQMTFAHEEGKLTYIVRIEMQLDAEFPQIWDKVILGTRVLLDRRNRELVAENDGVPVDNFVLQPHIPAISQVNANQFPRLRQLRRFFEGLLFLDCHRFDGRRMEVSEGLPVLNEFGSNLASVLHYFQENEPSRFRAIEEMFLHCFPRFERNTLKAYMSQEPTGELHAPLLYITEKGVGTPIPHTEWSDGLLRILSMITIPHSRTAEEHPSFICLDEIDNGLDINSLSHALSIFAQIQKQTQILITTHSPLASSLVEGSHWRVIHREGHRVFFDQADGAELERERRELVKAHYDFFRKHVSRAHSGQFN